MPLRTNPSDSVSSVGASLTIDGEHIQLGFRWLQLQELNDSAPTWYDDDELLAIYYDRGGLGDSTSGLVMSTQPSPNNDLPELPESPSSRRCVRDSTFSYVRNDRGIISNRLGGPPQIVNIPFVDNSTANTSEEIPRYKHRQKSSNSIYGTLLQDHEDLLFDHEASLSARLAFGSEHVGTIRTIEDALKDHLPGLQRVVSRLQIGCTIHGHCALRRSHHLMQQVPTFWKRIYDRDH